jgi:hypothetical protein
VGVAGIPCAESRLHPRNVAECRGRAEVVPTRDALPRNLDCAANIARPVFSFLTVHFHADGPCDPNSTASSKRAAVAIHLLANVRRLRPFRCAWFCSFSSARRMTQNGSLAGDAEFAAKQACHAFTVCLALWARRERRGNRVRILTSVPRRGSSLSLGPDRGEFRHERTEQTGREKPISVQVARAGEGTQVEARPRKFVHFVDDNP